MRNTVVIIREGGFRRLRANQGDYDALVRLMKIGLMDEDLIGRSIAVEVVSSSADAFNHVSGAENEAVFVFVTQGMLKLAREIKTIHRSLRVVVLTASMEGINERESEGVVVASKMDVVSQEDIKRVILGEDSPAT